MKKIIIFLFILVSTVSFSQKTIEKKFDLSNGTSKNVKIYIPKDYETDTIHKYPIAIVLNDEYLFNLYKGNAQLFADADLAPRQIVVGIHTDQSTNKDVSVVKQNLGLTKSGNVFFNFIKKDLLTYIQANYKTSPFLTLVGEGRAANYITYFLGENKPIFNAYVCIAPKFTERTNRLIESYNLKRLENIDNTYFIYSSNSYNHDEKYKKDFIDLGTFLSSFDQKKLKVQFDSFKDSPNKLSSISESVPRAFSHIFKLYRNISKEEFNEKIKDLEPQDAVKYLEQRYIDLEYLYGTNLNVRLEDFYTIEGIVMDKMDGDYLRVLGDFALIKHPNLPLGDYYMGMFYELGKDYKRAEDYYKFGYGKMDPSDPNADAFYKNIDRVSKLAKSQPKEEPLPLEDEEKEEEEEDNEEEKE